MAPATNLLLGYMASWRLPATLNPHRDVPRAKKRAGRSLYVSQRAALHLTPASGNEPHTTKRISKSRRRWNPTTMSESKDIARTTCEQTAADSGQMCRQNESSARAMLALWVSIWRRARREATFGMTWKVAGSAECATCAFESLLFEHPPTA